jgi:hypothetical protein
MVARFNDPTGCIKLVVSRILSLDDLRFYSTQKVVQLWINGTGTATKFGHLTYIYSAEIDGRFGHPWGPSAGMWLPSALLQITFGWRAPDCSF